MHPTTLIDAPPWGSVTPAGPRLWRVHERHGRIVGHVRAVPASADGLSRFRAERFHAANGDFRILGEFRAARDAMETLRQ